MGRAGRYLAVFLPAALLCSTASAQIYRAGGMVECAAHFQARSEWLHALEKNKDTSRLMQLHAQVLLTAANKSIGPTDWRMPTYGSRMVVEAPRYDFEVDQKTLDEITRFVEVGYGKAGMPLCVEDEKCIDCTRMLNEIVK